MDAICAASIDGATVTVWLGTAPAVCVESDGCGWLFVEAESAARAASASSQLGASGRGRAAWRASGCRPNRWIRGSLTSCWKAVTATDEGIGESEEVDADDSDERAGDGAELEEVGLLSDVLDELEMAPLGGATGTRISS